MRHEESAPVGARSRGRASLEPREVDFTALPGNCIDIQQAERFLTLIDESAEVWHFRALAEAGGRDQNHTGTLDGSRAWLEARHREGCGLFVVVNKGGQRTDQITRVRAVWADLDGAPLAPVMACGLAPHVVIETSPGRWHVYWLCGLPLDQFTGTQLTIAERFGGDPTVKDLPRIMRLPGSWHRKAAPHPVRIVDESCGQPYTAEVIAAAFPPKRQESPPKAANDNRATGIVDGARNKTLASLAGTMKRRALDTEAIEAALQVHNRKHCQSPLDVAEVRNIAKSIGKYAPAEQPPVPALRVADLGGLDAAEAPPVRWTVDGLIPADHVTLLGGHGGAGKTMLALILAAHVATGRDWAGFHTGVGRALILSLEDGPELIRWRLRRIAEQYALPVDRVADGVTLACAADTHCALMEQGSDFPPVATATPAMGELAKLAHGHALVVVDGASDAFDADENRRRDVRAFMRELAGIARDTGAAVVLLAHIDKAAAKYGSNGQSFSGSTAWHNSARSRLALVVEDDRIELRQEKCNLARLADPVPLRWSDGGVLVAREAANDASASALILADDAKTVLAALAAAIEAGSTVTTA